MFQDEPAAVLRIELFGSVFRTIFSSEVRKVEKTLETGPRNEALTVEFAKTEGMMRVAKAKFLGGSSPWFC